MWERSARRPRERRRRAGSTCQLDTDLPLGPAAYAVRSEASTPRLLCSGRLNGEASPWPQGVQAAVLTGGWICAWGGVITLPGLGLGVNRPAL